MVDHSSPLQVISPPVDLKNIPLSDSSADCHGKMTDNGSCQLANTAPKSITEPKKHNLASQSPVTDKHASGDDCNPERIISASVITGLSSENTEVHPDIRQEDAVFEVLAEENTDVRSKAPQVYTSGAAAQDTCNPKLLVPLDSGKTQASQSTADLITIVKPLEETVNSSEDCESSQTTANHEMTIKPPTKKTPDTSDKVPATSDSRHTMSASSSQSTGELVIDMSRSLITSSRSASCETLQVNASLSASTDELRSGSSSTLPDYSHIIASDLDVITNDKGSQVFSTSESLQPINKKCSIIHGDNIGISKPISKTSFTQTMTESATNLIVEHDFGNNETSGRKVTVKLGGGDASASTNSGHVESLQPVTSCDSLSVGQNVDSIITDCTRNTPPPAPKKGSSIANALKNKLGRLKIRSSSGSNCKFDILFDKSGIPEHVIVRNVMQYDFFKT